MLNVTRAFKLSLVHDLAVDTINGVFAGQHGHDFTIEVTVSGVIEPSTGILAQRKSMKAIIDEAIVRPLHGQKLNNLIEPASAERLSEYVYEKIMATELGSSLLAVEIVETRKNRFQFFKR